jgi:hypothetical protein
MKAVLLGLFFIGLFVDSSLAATCEDRAQACMNNNGKKEVCYGAALAQCKKTGTYVGPYTGKAFTASK